MKLALTIPGYGDIDTSKLPRGVPTGGLSGAGGNILRTFIEALLVFAVFVALFFILRGAVAIIMSGGEKERFTKGREEIRLAIIGLLVVFFSVFVISIVSYIFGVDLLSGKVISPPEYIPPSSE